MDTLIEYAGYISLIGFFSAFTGVAVWAYWPKNRDRIEAWRDIPFKETDNG